MRIDGVRGAPIERVELDEFFSEPTWVDVRIITPIGRATLREIMMEGFEVGEMDARSRKADVKTNTKGMAEREMRVRDEKLRHTFAGCSITSDGVKVEWNRELWAALDEQDPRILGKVVDAIDRQSKLIGEETDSDPI